MISKWLERDYEKLLLQIQNVSDAKKSLTILYRQRVNQVIAIIAILLLDLFGILTMMAFSFITSITLKGSMTLEDGQAVAIFNGIMLGLIAIIGINYLSIDTKIKMIKIAMSLKSTTDIRKE